MLNYKESMKILEMFHAECYEFQSKQKDPFPNAKIAALIDVANITTNPYSPYGEKLNLEAIVDFRRKMQIVFK